jgi:hypothetical protein
MDRRHVMDYINYEIQATGRKKMWVAYFACFLFLLMELPFAVFYGLTLIKALLISINVLTLTVMGFATVKNRKDWMVFGVALVFTCYAITFVSATCFALYSSGFRSMLTFGIVMFLYCVGGVASILHFRRLVRQGRFPGKGSGKPLAVSLSVYLGFGALSTGIIRLVGRKAKTALAYDTQMLIGTGIFWTVGMALSIDCHMYLCFYYMRKYRIS